MITELMVLYGIFSMLVIIVLMLYSVLQGIADTLDQRKEIFIKQIDWMNDVSDILFSSENKKSPIIIGDESPDIDHQKMFDDGIKLINELNEKKSKE